MDIDYTYTISEHFQNTGEWDDLLEKAEAADVDLDEAIGNRIDEMQDYIESDMEYLVIGWLENHGCQLIDLIESEIKKLKEDENE